MTRPCCKRSRCGTTFPCTNAETGNGCCSRHVLGYLFPILRAKNNAQFRGKQKHPAPTANTTGTYLSMVNIGNAPVPKVPRHCHQANCFQQGMLEFEGPIGQCFSRFPIVSSRRRGEKESCWLVGCFGFNGRLRQYFSLYRAVSQREGERGDKG